MLEHAQSRKFWSPARQFPAQNFKENHCNSPVSRKIFEKNRNLDSNLWKKTKVGKRRSLGLVRRLPKKLGVFKTRCNVEVCRRSLFLFACSDVWPWWTVEPAISNPGYLESSAISTWNPFPMVLLTVFQSFTIGYLELGYLKFPAIWYKAWLPVA